MRVHRIAILAFTALTGFAPRGLRADGTTDINIDPSATYAISVSGSYRLVANVTMNSGTAAIAINVPDVDLDLGGHAITGTGTPANAISGADKNLRVHNGSLVGFPLVSINFTGTDCRVTDVTVRSTGSAPGVASGIKITGARAVVERCDVSGITSTGNSATGIQLGGVDSRVIDCNVATINSGTAQPSVGIDASASGCEVRGNRVSSVGTTTCTNAIGIQCGDGQISDNTLFSIGTAATSLIYGIYCSSTSASIIEKNVLGTIGSTLAGFSCGIQVDGSGVAGTRVSDNNISKVIGAGGATHTGIGGGIPGLLIEGNTIAECQGSSPSSASFTAISGSTETVIRRNICRNNDAGNNMSGIAASTGSTVENNSVLESSGTNVAVITAGANSLVRGNVARNNDASTGLATGINVADASTVDTNTIGGMGAVGAVVAIFAASGQDCIVRNNTCVDNDSSGASMYGIDVGSASIVEGNTVSSSGGVTTIGIRANVGISKIIGNTVRDNDASTGAATGIYAQTGSIIEGNVVEGNNEGATNNNTATGIRAFSRCMVRGNQCSNNGGAGTDGGATGIAVDSNCIIENNTCDNNDGTGTGIAVGISVSAGGNRILNNLLNNHSSGSGGSHGILVSGTDNLVAGNTTTGNGTRGITINGSGNRTESNRSFDTAIFGGSGLTGDLADVQIP